MSKTPLSPYETEVLKEFAGLRAATYGGAAKNSAVEALRSRRFVDSAGLISFAGRQYLREDGYDVQERR